MGGAAPEVDAGGNIWAATGNGTSDVDLRRQRLRDRALARPGAEAVVRTERLVQDDNERPGPRIGRRRHCSRTAPPSRPASRRRAFLLEPGEPRRRRGRRHHHEIPLCPGNDVDGGNAVRRDGRVHPAARAGVQAIQTSPSLSVLWQAASGDIGTADRRRRPRLVDRRGHARRASTPRTGDTVRAGPRRRRGQPLPDPVGGRRPPPGPVDRPGRTPSPARPDSRARRRPRRPPRRTRRTGWSRPTAASSPSATPASTGRPAASR